MAGIVYTKLLDALKGIGVDVSQQQASNVKKLSPKNKSTATKVGLLAAERDKGGNFATVLDIFKDEAKYIDSMNDAEQMAFLNNIIDYNEFGGQSISTSKGIEALNEVKKFEKTKSELKKALEDLQSTAEKNKNDALKDLDDFLETGGQPFKKKDDKYLGGSMHEEGQLRTGIREFLQNEYKNGRIKLDKTDQFRIMEYSPMMEDDPIRVFRKIYGEEAYNKAGTFPGAFEIGEDYTHYRKIFEENMGTDLLKVKDKKYVGDGTLVLTKREEVFEPTPDDEDMPFAKGGRASFAGGKLVSEFIALIVKKEPIEAMKEVNKVIGKKGKYKNLTQKDIDKIVADTEDHIFQRDPDNLYVYDDGKTVYDDDMSKKELIEKEGRKYDLENIEGNAEKRFFKGVEIKDPTFDETLPFDNDAEKLAEIKMSNEAYDMEKARGTEPKLTGSADDMSVEDSLTTMEGLGATQTAERFRLKQKYPGITDDLVDKILIDDNPQRKAELIAALDEAFIMMGKGKGPDEIVEIFKNQKRTKNAKGGRAGFYAGGQSMIEPDLSDIGHGSDSLMARTRLTAPGSQATTSTGLNYLLGEDNDNTRVPFNSGLLVPPPKPKNFSKTLDLLNSKAAVNTLSPKTYANLVGQFAKKAFDNGELSEREYMKIVQPLFGQVGEMVTEKIREYENFSKGGRINFQGGGGADMGTVADSQGNVNENLGNNFEAPDDRSTFDQTVSHFNSTLDARNKPTALDKTITAIDMGNTLNKGYNFLSGGGLKSIFSVNPFALGAMTLAKIAQKKKQRKDAYDKQTDFANGGIADLRQGYAGGTLVDKGRRGFLKLLGATAGGVAALKLGLGKMLGKESGAVSKKVIDEVIIDGGTGAPAWLQPLVNKALREGMDKTKTAAYKDAQVVKSLDTPTGKVDVYYDIRTGEVEIDYIGGNTALGESVNMRYTPGIADEGTGGKPADEFEATESIPEGRGYSYGDEYDYSIEAGENTTDNVKNLFSDTSELAELGGQKTLTKDIVETVKKKKVLKKMQDNPEEFITDVQGDYVPD